MSNTIRSQPSSGAYMRRQRHKQFRQAEEAAEDALSDVPNRHGNRIAARNARIADPWDDQIVSEYRGQIWHRRHNTRICRASRNTIRDFDPYKRGDCALQARDSIACLESLLHHQRGTS